MLVRNRVEFVDDGTTVSEYACSKLHSSGREDEDDAFMVCNVEEVIKKWREFRGLLPDIKPYYAVKCNADIHVLNVLGCLGANFDCASKGEIQKVLDIGVSPERIVYAHTCKQVSHLSYAQSNNINLMTFDNECELYKIKKYHPDANLLIRIKVDDSKSHHSLADKFGIQPSEVCELLKVGKNLNLNIVGVCFHVGCRCFDGSVFYDAVKSAKYVFDQASKMGYTFNILDIGGGFPRTENEGASMQDIACSLNSGITEFFPAGCGVKIIAEPGRYMVASAFTLVCNVTSVRKIRQNQFDDRADEFAYYINDGVYGSMSHVRYEERNPTPYTLQSELHSEKFESIIWGQTCDSSDVISRKIMLPKLSVGDWLCFDNSGAYTISIMTGFNGFNGPVVFYMCPSSFQNYLPDQLFS